MIQNPRKILKRNSINMDCWNCIHASILIEPKHLNGGKIYGYCFKNGKQPIHIPEGRCKDYAGKDMGSTGTDTVTTSKTKKQQLMFDL